MARGKQTAHRVQHTSINRLRYAAAADDLIRYYEHMTALVTQYKNVADRVACAQETLYVLDRQLPLSPEDLEQHFGGAAARKRELERDLFQYMGELEGVVGLIDNALIAACEYEGWDRARQRVYDAILEEETRRGEEAADIRRRVQEHEARSDSSSSADSC